MNFIYLKESRIKKGLMQKDIANLFDVSISSVCQWEKGVKVPKTNIVIGLCKALDMDANILLGLK